MSLKFDIRIDFGFSQTMVIGSRSRS